MMQQDLIREKQRRLSERTCLPFLKIRQALEAVGYDESMAHKILTDQNPHTLSDGWNMPIPMTPTEAAALFLSTRGSDPVADNEALVKLFTEIAASAIRTALGVDNEKLSLDEMLKEITASQPGASTAPGLQLAYLADKGLYYAAVHTFPMGTVDSRTVVAKATGADMVSAMVKCLIAYRSSLR